VNLSAENLSREFEKRGPWITRFVIEGRPYGGEYDLMNDVRIPRFFESFPEAQVILELGGFEGGHTFSLAKHPGVSRVLGVEGREPNLQKARFVQTLQKLTKVEFVLSNLETLDLSSCGQFDVVFCSGLLYHLPEPWD
jgi:2-polyprenyl-3-methyl-5-hydroxy-6-metoxy-1,4-benzoquinol methylase